MLRKTGFTIRIFNFDFDKHTAVLPDNGLNPFPASTHATLSKVIISLFEDPSLISNRFYHVSDGVLTQQDVFKVVEKETGVKWARSSYSTKDVRANALKKIAKGNYTPLEYMHSLMTPFFGGIQVWSHVDNEALGLTFGEVDLREELEKLVKGQVQRLARMDC